LTSEVKKHTMRLRSSMGARGAIKNANKVAAQ
jgi:hypothetical protein